MGRSKENAMLWIPSSVPQQAASYTLDNILSFLRMSWSFMCLLRSAYGLLARKLLCLLIFLIDCFCVPKVEASSPHETKRVLSNAYPVSYMIERGRQHFHVGRGFRARFVPFPPLFSPV